MYFLSCSWSMNYNRLIRVKMLVLHTGLHFQQNFNNTGNYIIALLSNNLPQIPWSLISLTLTIIWLIQSRKRGNFRFSCYRYCPVSFYPRSHALFLISCPIIVSSFFYPPPLWASDHKYILQQMQVDPK